MSEPGSDPAHQRLDEHLALLRAAEFGGGSRLAVRVVHRARWQRAVRAPLRAAASVLGAVASGLGALAPRRERRR